MSSVTGFNYMLVDSVRMDAYGDALRQSVTPGSVVVDIGTGTVIMALLACQFGARRVYAVEPMEAIEWRAGSRRRTGTAIGSSSSRGCRPNGCAGLGEDCKNQQCCPKFFCNIKTFTCQTIL